LLRDGSNTIVIPARAAARTEKELGEGDEKTTEIAEVRELIKKAGMPKEAEEQAT
jgi:ATP-dependent Lon protease